MNSDTQEHCDRLLDFAKEELYHLVNNHFSGFGEKLSIIVRSVRRDDSEDVWIDDRRGVRRRYKLIDAPEVDITLELSDDYDFFDRHIDIDGCCNLPHTIAYVSHTGNNKIFLDIELMRDAKILMSM